MSADTDPDHTGTPLPPIVDWAVALALFLGGVLALLVGTLSYAWADRDAIADLVAEGVIHSDVLTDADLIEVTYTMAWWGGLGLLVVGALLAVGALLFVWYRRRAQRRGETPRAPPATWPNAIVGAVVTIVTAAIPLSPIVGGAVAGYLEGGDGSARARVGALAGLLSMLPVVVLFLFVVGGFITIQPTLGTGAVAVIMAGLVIAFVAVILYTIGLGALGGYLSLVVTDAD